ncbi:MAG: IclR family transcriptional regulator [Desulfuromonadaceae bacterium]|nr:IclR family transcriptional regulator [Desulfuromonadaceae bacterium]MDD2856102.1 IclR family transcriptional regulator [Desulfuromonadaceae bacterium]
MKKIITECNVQAVINAFDLMGILTEENTIPINSHLAKKLKINDRDLLPIIETLRNRGLIEQDIKTGNYHLGLKAFEMAQGILRSSIVNIAQPIMEDLARKHDEAVYITVLNNDEVLFLDMVDTYQQVKTVPFVGKRFPFFTNAAGKVIKAMSSSDVIDKFTKRKATKAGILDVQGLESELYSIRQNGIAIDNGGLGEGISSVAVAIRDYAGIVVGALTLLAPSFRMLQNRLEQEIIPSMLMSSEELSTRFGYTKISA